MDKDQETSCIFCGTNANEKHKSSIGEIFIHAECLTDLEEILSLTEKEMEVIKIKS